MKGGVTEVIELIHALSTSILQQTRDEEVLTMRFQKGYVLDYLELLEVLRTGISSCWQPTDKQVLPMQCVNAVWH